MNRRGGRTVLEKVDGWLVTKEEIDEEGGKREGGRNRCKGNVRERNAG